MAEVASAFVSIMPSARGFGKKLDGEISGDISKSGKKSGLSFGKLFAAGAALGIGAKGISFLGDSLDEGREAQKVSALVANAIKATGGAANVTAKQVDRLATSISKKTGIDDEQIAMASSLILTFKNVANEGRGVNAIFDRATSAAVDLSAAGFGSVDSAAKQLGKALQDPVKGVTALGRAGVTFSEQQKTQIKQFVETGNLLKAQKLILAEVNSQVGGAAAATATESAKAAVAAGNLKEQIGTALIPVVDSLANTFTTKVAPAISGFVTGMTTGTGAGGRFAAVFTTVGSAVASAAGFINQHRRALAALAAVIGAVVAVTKIHTAVMAAQAAGGLVALVKGTKAVASVTKAYTAVQWLLNAALTANPIGIVVVALAALGAGLVIAYRKSETFRNIVNGAFSAVVGFVKKNWPAIVGLLTGPFGLAAALIIKNWDSIKAGGTRVLEFIKGLPTKIAAIFTGAATIFYNAGAQLMGQLAAGIADKIGDAIAAAQAGLSKLKGLLPGSPIKWGPLKNWNNGGAGKRLMDLVARGITDATPKTVRAAKSAFEKIGDALEATRDKLQSTLDGLKGDFASIVDSVASAFTGDLFSPPEGTTFIDNLLEKKGELTGLLASFNTLKGWGIDPAFLTQLFSSGNGALITELAGMGQAGAVGAANLFGEVTSLGNQLGNAVASNDPVATRIDETNRLLEIAVDQLAFLGSDIGQQLNQAASKAQRTKKNRGKK